MGIRFKSRNYLNSLRSISLSARTPRLHRGRRGSTPLWTIFNYVNFLNNDFLIKSTLNRNVKGNSGGRNQ